jgi:O-antigen/teichoic acid export membrane protein
VGGAYAGLGWKALCLAEAGSAAILAICLILHGRPACRHHLPCADWRRLIRFGATLTVANLVYWASSNVPQIVIGIWMSPAALGLFTRASTLSARFGSLLTG